MNADIVTVEISLFVNGRECYYATTVRRQLWEYPEFRLSILRSLKSKLLEGALVGLEPRVTVHEGEWRGPLGAPLESVTIGGDSVTVECR